MVLDPPAAAGGAGRAVAARDDFRASVGHLAARGSQLGTGGRRARLAFLGAVGGDGPDADAHPVAVTVLAT